MERGWLFLRQKKEKRGPFTEDFWDKDKTKVGQTCVYSVPLGLLRLIAAIILPNSAVSVVKVHSKDAYF